MTGHNAGVDVCAVTYGYGSSDVLRGLGPAYMVDAMSEIKELLL